MNRLEPVVDKDRRRFVLWGEPIEAAAFGTDFAQRELTGSQFSTTESVARIFRQFQYCYVRNKRELFSIHQVDRAAYLELVLNQVPL